MHTDSYNFNRPEVLINTHRSEGRYGERDTTVNGASI